MSDLYLVHHGIKGQRWGERNGPPYPLDRHSAKELRRKMTEAGKKDHNATPSTVAERLQSSVKVNLTEDQKRRLIEKHNAEREANELFDDLYKKLSKEAQRIGAKHYKEYIKKYPNEASEDLKDAFVTSVGFDEAYETHPEWEQENHRINSVDHKAIYNQELTNVTKEILGRHYNKKITTIDKKYKNSMGEVYKELLRENVRKLK